ncbi:MAG TPA: hypothetical protein VN776_12950 [Terracidiphilus sp.]|nr:hypothetical protein [Terracidiphilus sp.]
MTIGFVLSYDSVLCCLFGHAVERESLEQGKTEVICLLHPKHICRVAPKLLLRAISAQFAGVEVQLEGPEADVMF